MFENLESLKSHVEKKLASLKEAYLFSDLDKYTTKSFEFLNYSKEYGFKYFETFRDKYDKYTPDIKFNKEKYRNHVGTIYLFLVVLLATADPKDEEEYSFLKENIIAMANDINRLSLRFNVSCSYIRWPQIVLDARYLRANNVDLRQKFRNCAVHLHEHKLSQFDTSKITDKSISENGLNEAKLIDASFGKDSITLQFEVDSTGDNTHVDLTGKTQVFLKRGYSVTIQFLKTDNYLSPTNVNKDAIAQQFNSVIQNCDAKVYCDCPAFYWQGMAEKDAKQGDSYFGFRGQHGTGYWNNLHNVKGPQACKHIWSAIYFVNTEQKQICDKLASKIVNSANVYDNIINQN